MLTPYIGRAAADIVGPWKRTTSPQTHGRLFQANVSHYKQQLADKLGIAPSQPGSIHFGSENRGFDEEFFLQLLSEHKEVKLSRGMRTIQVGYDGDGPVFTGRIPLPDRPDGRAGACPGERREVVRAPGARPTDLGCGPPGAIA